MIYLIDKFDPELIDFAGENDYFSFELWLTSEQRVKAWIENERCRSIFSRKEVINLFNPRYKIQMVKVKKFKLHRFDKIIIWTPTGNYFVLEVIGYKK